MRLVLMRCGFSFTVILFYVLGASSSAFSQTEPASPRRPAFTVPENDPRPAATSAPLSVIMNQHPRLLFSAGDVDALRTKTKTPVGQIITTAFNKYLTSCVAPKQPVFISNDTEGQRYGLWQLPTLALNYVLTGDISSRDRAVAFLHMLNDLETWQTGEEFNSGMGAGNLLAGAALAYDWLYNDLDPSFREAFRKKLLFQARSMYYRGHLNGNKALGYWQNDPQNNHRWHRNAGMVLAVLAAYTGAEEEQWILERVREELDFVMRWRPDDGSYSEGPRYMLFGGIHLMLALEASDRCLGTSFLKSPFILNNSRFMVQSMVPDQSNLFFFNDGGYAKLEAYANYLYRVAAISRDGEMQHLLNDVWRKNPTGSAHVAWLALLGYDSGLAEAAPEKFETRSLFADAGVAFMRDGWSRDSVAAMFRCMPIGGRVLNEFRDANNYQYVNVAHDHPDANSFVIWKNGNYLAETARYPYRKQSASHNTILINGMGQMPHGRPEPQHWMQPAEKGSMLDMACITAWQPGRDVVIIEGEAAGAYTSAKNKAGRVRNDLSRYRRTLIWVESRYLLVLDDIRSGGEPVEMTWLMQGPSLTVRNAERHEYVLAHSNATCQFQVVADTALRGSNTVSTADDRGKVLGWEQLQLSSDPASAFRVAAVFDPWGHNDVRVTLNTQDKDHAVVQVHAGGCVDEWQWGASPDKRTPSSLIGRRAGDVLAVLGAESVPDRN